MEANHEVSIHELPVPFDQLLIGSFVPVLGFPPQFIELLQSTRGQICLVEVEVLVNGTPRAVQSASNPTIDKGRSETRSKDGQRIHVRMTGTGRLTGEEEFTVCGRQEELTVDITVPIHTRPEECKCT